MDISNYESKNGLPLFSKINEKSINSIISLLINNFNNDFKNLEKEMKNEKKNFYNLAIYKLEKIEYFLNYYLNIVNHLLSVKNNKLLRTNYEKILPKIIKITNKVSKSKILYKTLKNSSKQNLNNIQKYIIKKELLRLKLNGTNLNEQNKKKYLIISLKMSNLSLKYGNNVLDSINDYQLIIKRDENMKNMPKSALDLFSENAKKKFKHSTSINGPWVIGLDSHSIDTFLSYYPETNKRKEFYKKTIQIASYGKFNNTNLIYKILDQKNKFAKLLGYKNYVELSLVDKMANEKSIYKLLNNISKKALLKNKKDLKMIFEYFKIDKIEYWDKKYYLEKYVNEKFKFDKEEIKSYLLFDNVLQGLFKLSSRLFDIKIIEIDIKKQEINSYDKDLRLFYVYNVNNLKKRIASFYLDPYVRTGEKNSGAWMNAFSDRSKNLNQIPVAYLILNISPPLKNKPSLLSITDYQTLFHEFGHGLQHMLTEIDESYCSGLNNIEWDAVEICSQFMENWCFHKKTIMSFAKHYKTGKTLPNELYEKMIKYEKFFTSSKINNQIYFSMLDLYIHKHKITNYKDIQKKLSKKYLINEIDKDDCFLCHFDHIFSGSYDAGYYSYAWAEILSLDAFSAFEEIDMNNDKELKKMGIKFRKTFLAKGGSQETLTIFKEFRGREPNSNAYLKHYNLI